MDKIEGECMKLIYDWNSFDKDCFKLAAQLEKYKPFTLFGVPRGGLIVAVRLSHITGMKLVQCVEKNTIIIDDILQTGRTLTNVTYYLTPKEDYKIVATLWIVNEEIARPDIWIRAKSEKDWVVFPWETEESSRYDGTVQDVSPPEDYLTPNQLKEKGFDKIMLAELDEYEVWNS